MQELKIPPTAAPYFSSEPTPLSPPIEATQDIGTKALVERLQGKLDAAFEKNHEPRTDIWRIERDAEMQMLRGTLAALEKQTSGAMHEMAQQQSEQTRQLRELFEQQAKNRPRRIRAPSGKVYEVE